MKDETRISDGACAVVVGVGARLGIGGALCARFAAEGLPVYAAGRNQEKLDALANQLEATGPGIAPVCLDSSDPGQVRALFDEIENDGRVPDIVVFNAAEPNIPRAMLDMTPDHVETMWRTCCFAGFLVGQQAIDRMLPRSRGTLIFTGATASLRGRARFGAFAAAKAGLRAHAQAMAREFGPLGIHCAHVIIDGVVNGDRVATALGDAGKSYLAARGENGALDPDAIAQAYWQIHRQHPSAWTHEMDLRPFKEDF